MSHKTIQQFLFYIIKPHKWYVIGFLLTGLFWGINNALAPYVLKLIIDKAVLFEGDRVGVFSALLPLMLVYIFLQILFVVDYRTVDWIRLKFFPRLRFDIVQNMFSYLNRHSHAYFQNNFAGSLSNKISDMTSGVTTIFSLLDDTFAQLTGLIVAMIAMLIIHPIFAVIIIGWTIIFIAITWCFSKPIREYAHLFSASKTTLVGKMVDSISNVTTMRMFSRNRYENQLIDEAALDALDKDSKMQWYILKMRILWDVSIILLIGLNLYALVYMYSKNLVSVGDFAFITSLSISMFFGLWYLASQFVVFSEELGKCNQALSLIIAPHGVTDKPGAKKLIVTHGKITFNHVTFHYDKGAHLFNNKNVVIEAGEKIGLVGFSGSGKSTFVNLILRLFDVESGTICIDEQSIADITQDSLRENITLIPQDITLFHRTLLENIRYGCIHASDQDVIEASKKAYCHEFISALSEGYQSLVGERGIKLSGGQRQRIAIARAMLKNAPILILDEATSSLDSVTEKLIQNSLHTLMMGRTTIVIAHRLSTLSEMDRILVFDQGCIVEEGTHQELVQRNGHYAKMWHMQAGGFLPQTAS